MPTDILDMFRTGLKQAKKERKSDDILAFMRKHWKLFCSTSTQMQLLCEELEGRGELDPTGLADALGLPEYVVMKKVKVVDTASLMLRPQKHALMKLFKETSKGAPLVLMAVAGDHSVILTNVPTEEVPGLVHVYVKGESEGDTVQIFRAEDAGLRLPNIFKGAKEDYE